MRAFSIIILCTFIPIACGGRFSQDTVINTSCNDVADCEDECPEGQTASACSDEGFCVCTETITEIVEVEVDDCQECYPLSRAEAIQQLMADLFDLSLYEPPVAPTYPDVPTDHPNFAAIEAATEQGILNGDSNGNFRPDDLLNRAEGAKVIIWAIDGLADYNAPTTPTFDDVASDAWYFDYVEAAVQSEFTQGYVNDDGTPTGFFGPADAASNCFFDAMLVRATILPEPQVRLNVSLASDTPASSMLAWGVPPEPELARYVFSASGGGVYIDTLVVTRGGVGQNEDWSTLLLEAPAQNILVQNQVEDGVVDTNTFHPHLFVPDGWQITVTLSGVLASYPTAANQHFFYIGSAADITTNADVVIEGDFPVSGNTFTIVEPPDVVTVGGTGGEAIQASPGQLGVELFNYELQSSIDVTARDTYMYVSLTSPNGHVPTPAATPVPATLAGSTGDTSAICATDLGGIREADMIEMVTSSGTVYAMVTDVLPATGPCTAGIITTGLAAGDAITGQVIEVQPFDFLHNLRLVDTGGGFTVAGPYVDVPYELVATEDYDIPAGQTLSLSLQIDLDADFPAGYRLQGGVRYSDDVCYDSYFRDLAANRQLLCAEVGGAVFGVMTGPLITVN